MIRDPSVDFPPKPKPMSGRWPVAVAVRGEGGEEEELTECRGTWPGG